MKIGIMKKVEVDAKTMKIYTTVTDRFTASLHDQDGREIYDQPDGYVPGLMPGEHYGDYIILDIDIDTVQITNWQTLTVDEIQEWISQGDEE